MGINIQEKQDISYLFSSLGSGAAGVAGSNFLMDYAAIKNGSYLKLMKAYYGEAAGKESAKSAAKEQMSRRSATALSSEDRKAYSGVQAAAGGLKASADALLASGTKSVFAQKDVTVKDENGMETSSKAYDTEAIYKAVGGFVDSYNALIQASGKTDDANVSRRTATMMKETSGSLKSLLSVGISVNADGTLALDKKDFMGAEMTKVKSLFGGNGSYAYRVSAQASLIGYAADNALSKGSFYSAKGAYTGGSGSGSLYNNRL